MQKQQLAIGSLFGEQFADAYRVAVQVSEDYGLMKDNPNFMMQKFQNSVNNSRSQTVINGGFGMTAGTSLGSRADQVELNNFLRVIEEFTAALRKFTMIHMDDIVRAMFALAEALLAFGSLFDGEDGQIDQMLEDLIIAKKEKGKDQRKELGVNFATTKKALMTRLYEAGYTDPTAANQIIEEVIKAENPEQVMKSFTVRAPGSSDKFKADVRDMFILGDILRISAKKMINYDRDSEKGLVDTVDPLKALDENIQRNVILRKEGLKQVRDKTARDEYKHLYKDIKKASPKEAEDRAKELEELKQKEADKLKPFWMRQSKFMLPSSIRSVGGDKMLQNMNQIGQQMIASHNVIEVNLNGKQIGRIEETIENKGKRTNYFNAGNIATG